MSFQKGNTPWIKDKHHSEETKKKIGDAQRGEKNHRYGKYFSFSKEHRRKLSEANKGKHHTKETKRKISEALKGHISWMKGKHHTEESKKKMSKALKGKISWMKGKHHKKETKEKISRKSKEMWQNKDSREKLLKCPQRKKGRQFSEKHCQKISDSLKGHQPKNSFGWKGEDHPNWQGGISFELYGTKFNEKLREQIRKRDNYHCQECFRHQDELFKNTKAGIKPYRLFVHHIDYDKQNNDQSNLVSLCMNCHMQTNFNRENWTEYYQNKRKIS